MLRGFEFWVLGSDVRHPGSSFRIRVPGTGFRVSSQRLPGKQVAILARPVRFRVAGVGSRIRFSGFGFQFPGSAFRA